MILELHPELSNQCSAPFQEAAQLYQNQNFVEACNSAMETFRGSDCDWNSLIEQDWLLLSALCKARGKTRRELAIHQLAFKYLPHSKLLGVLYAWDLLVRRRYFPALKLLEKLAADASDDYRSLVVAVQAYNYSAMEWSDTASTYHQQAVALASEEPISLYVLARAAGRRRKWNDAAALAIKAWKLAPKWARANVGLIDSLLAIDDHKTAREVLRLEQQNTPHVWLQTVRAVAFESLGETDDAVKCYQQVLELCDDGKMIRSFATRLALLRVQQGETKSAQEIISKYKLEDLVSVATPSCKSKSVYLALPLVSQTNYHCVPTVAAMVAGAQGVSACPATYASEMGTHDGTHIWQMIDYMKSLGFDVYCVRPEVDVVKALLDQGIPLIGQLPSLFSGHVDAICGYDDQIKRFHTRDPDHWHGSHLKYESLAERYEGSTSLIALIAPNRIADVELKEAWLNHEVQAFVDLSRAVASGQRLVAEAAHAKVNDDHPIAFTAARHGRLITINESTFQESVKKIVARCMADDKNEARITTQTMQALLQSLDADSADEIRAIAHRQRDNLNRNFINYVEAQCLVAEGDWRSALTKLTELAEKAPSSEQLWSQLASVQRQLGMREAAERSQQIVLEISPNSNSGNQNKLTNERDLVPFTQRVAKAHAMVAKYSATPSMRLSLASVLADSGDGLEYESALKDCLKYFPRYDWPYEQLANWYLTQDREDLAHSILEQGRALIGLQEMPLWSFEKTEQEGSDSEESPAEQSAVEKSNSDAEANEAGGDSGSSEADDQGNTTDQAWRQCYLDFKLPRTEFEATDAFQTLLRLQRESKMHWWHSVKLLVLRCRNLALDVSLDSAGDVDRIAALRTLLPENPPGVAENFVEQFLQQVTLGELSLAFRQSILDWIDRVTTRLNHYPNLRFERAFLVESLNRLNDAEAELRAVASDHPCFSGAFYRLGQIAEQRSAWETAANLYRDCLKVKPGHWGALNRLWSLSDRISQSDGEIATAFWKAYPYACGNISRVAEEIHVNQSPEAAHAFLDLHADKIEPSRKHMLHARLYYRGGQYRKAIEILDAGFNEADRDYGAEWLRCRCLIELKDYEVLADALRRIDQRWPGDPETLDQLARTLRMLNLSDAKEFSRNKMVAGNSIYVLAYVCLQDESDPFAVAMSILDDLDESCRAANAEQLSEAMEELGYAQPNLEFAKHCADRYPANTQFRVRLMNQYSAASSYEEAVEVGETLLKENPDNPEYLSQLAYCYQTTDADKGLDYLERSYNITGKVDSLVDLGRAQVNAEKQAAGRETLWRALSIDPVNTYAMANLLWFFDDVRSDLWKNIELSLETKAAQQQDMSYFTVLAYSFAKEHKRRLPIGAFTAGVARGKSVMEYGGSRSERLGLGVFLQDCLASWSKPNQTHVPHQTDESLPLLPPGFCFEDRTGSTVNEIITLANRLCNHGEDESGAVVTAQQAVEFHRESANEYLVKSNFEAAIPCLRRCIENFDDTIGRDEQLTLVIRLTDCENGGNVYEALTKYFPGNGQVALFLLMLSAGLPLGALGYVLEQYGLPSRVPIIGLGALAMIPVALHNRKQMAAAKMRLANFHREDNFIDLEHLTPAPEPVQVRSPELTDEIKDEVNV